MSIVSYHHGVRVHEINEGMNPLKIISTAIIGMVATASDADASAFPLNKPVLLTNVDAAIGKAGTKGTLVHALTAIRQQCRPIIIVVRVEDGAGATEQEKQLDQDAKVIGTTSGSQYSGLQALLVAQAQLGIKPRILGAPGLTSQAVTDELASIAGKLRAMAYASAHGDNVTEAIAYQKHFAQRELMLIWPGWRVFEQKTASIKDVSAEAYAMGLRAKIDQEQGWHKTLSNVPLSGVLGISRDVYWDLQSPDTDAGLLNQNNVTTLIQSQGHRFWGSRTCAADELFRFESAVRTAQVLADTMAEGHLWAVDKPLHPSLVKDILEGINAKFRELKALGCILDGQAWYDETVNESATLKTGRLVLDYDYTPIPPLEDINFRQRITDRYFADFAQRISAGQ
jgi:phage tail sheath protein FI